MNEEQKSQLIQSAEAAITAFNPAIGGTVVALASVATSLVSILNKIKKHDPAAWAAVRADFKGAVEGFEAAVAAHTENG